ncbi:MAG TPA: alpha/beta fold hydrolase [Nevskiaceae bacterium]
MPALFRRLPLLLLAGALLSLTGQAQTATPYLVAPNLDAGISLALDNPQAPPAGANLPDCRSATHPWPIVLINGTFAVMQTSFAALAPHLANAGYCVHAFNYGLPYDGAFIGAVGPIGTSAEQLKSFVHSVLAQTGAAKVDLVGYSLGGMLAEYYLKFLGGAQHVRALVALSPTTHGTTFGNMAPMNGTQGLGGLLGTLCQACIEQLAGSAIIRRLDDGPIAQPGVRYTVIETRHESVVTPVGSSFIHEPGVVNQYVQSWCPNDTVDHANLTYDNVVFRLIENALDPKTAEPADCALAFPAAAR